MWQQAMTMAKFERKECGNESCFETVFRTFSKIPDECSSALYERIINNLECGLGHALDQQATRMADAA